LTGFVHYPATTSADEWANEILDVSSPSGSVVREASPETMAAPDVWRQHKRQQRLKPRVYDDQVVTELIKLWELLNYLCGKRLGHKLILCSCGKRYLTSYCV